MRQLLAQAIDAEVRAFLDAHSSETLSGGRQWVVRHGYGPEREILTGIGRVPVRRAKVRDRETVQEDQNRIRFSSSILPAFARRAPSLNAALPVLYLRGLSSGDFHEALPTLLGKDAPNLSPQVLSRLKTEWAAKHDRWRRRYLSVRHYVYIWADGIYLQGWMEDEKPCLLVLIGATPEGCKELIGFTRRLMC